MTLTNEQIEQIKVERLQQDIENRPVPFFGNSGATANAALEDDFARPKAETVKPVTEARQVPDNDEAAVSELSPEEEDEQLALQALKSMANADRATTAFVERHKKDFYPSPETGAKMYGFLNEAGLEVNRENLEFAFSELTKSGVHLGKPKRKISGLPNSMSRREPEQQDDYVALGEKMRSSSDLGEAKQILLDAMRRQRQRTEEAGWSL
jgi:hypothetical protein